MSNRATISERFVKERYIVSHLDKRNILPMVQMILWAKPKGINQKEGRKARFIVETMQRRTRNPETIHDSKSLYHYQLN